MGRARVCFLIIDIYCFSLSHTKKSFYTGDLDNTHTSVLLLFTAPKMKAVSPYTVGKQKLMICSSLPPTSIPHSLLQYHSSIRASLSQSPSISLRSPPGNQTSHTHAHNNDTNQHNSNKSILKKTKNLLLLFNLCNNMT